MNQVIAAESERIVFQLPAALTIATVPAVMTELQSQPVRAFLLVDCAAVAAIDSAGVALLDHIAQHWPNSNCINMPAPISQIVELFPIPPQELKKRRKHRLISLRRRILGISGIHLFGKKSLKQFILFLSDVFYYVLQGLVSHRGLQKAETLKQIYLIAYNSAAILCVISFLVGLTISLTSAAQLKLFGADIYLADMAGLALIKELIPLMTGIILAGKIGAAITAEISSMVVLEEVDALKTMGLQPIRFLMVPRMLAMTAAVPMLLSVALLVGLAAAVLVARVYLGIMPGTFMTELLSVVVLKDFLLGLEKTFIFGWAIVVASGYKGFSVRGGAEGVGQATTESVVLSISLIIAIDCVFAFILYF